MRPICALLALLCVPSLGLAQDEEDVLPQRHNVYLEILGNANRYSVNYERTFSEHHRLRAGLAIWTGGETTAITETELMIPLMYNLLVGPGPHYLELGGGVLAGVVNREQENTNLNFNFLSATGTVGYRFQLPYLEWILRVGYTPIYSFGDGDKAYPKEGFVSRVGISIGRAFN